jgi:hypothetical protein
LRAWDRHQRLPLEQTAAATTAEAAAAAELQLSPELQLQPKP